MRSLDIYVQALANLGKKIDEQRSKEGFPYSEVRNVRFSTSQPAGEKFSVQASCQIVTAFQASDDEQE